MSKLVSHKEYLLVEVAKEADEKKFIISNAQSDNDLLYKAPGYYKYIASFGTVNEQYEIIGKADQLGNEQWNEIVDQIKQPLWVYWKDYVGKKSMTSPTASGLSLLASHDMKASETLILKKQ